MKYRGACGASLILFGVMLLAHATSAVAAGYAEVEVSGGGSVVGKLTFEGALPEDAVEKIGINKNPDVCDVEGTGFREIVWVDVKDGALRGAGDTFWAMCISVGFHWLFVPITMLMLRVWGCTPRQAWSALVAIILVFCLVFSLRYYSGKWRSIKVLGPPADLSASGDGFHEPPDVRHYGRWMRDEAEKRIGHLYPKVEITADMVKVWPDLDR